MTRFGVGGFVERVVPCAAICSRGFFPPEKEGKKETTTVESGWARTSLSDRHRPSLVTLTQYTRASLVNGQGKEYQPCRRFPYVLTYRLMHV